MTLTAIIPMRENWQHGEIMRAYEGKEGIGGRGQASTVVLHCDGKDNEAGFRVLWKVASFLLVNCIAGEPLAGNKEVPSMCRRLSDKETPGRH